ncbi:RNA polymerase I termination factor [Cynara cardunculus var. scolymus]|uniref:Homeodomain-like protein n=1 Tax=Cynara cardunculus var. scolymus TaxID=59895 RepID=A0A103YIY9_CYNCS|nr:RNA polymerase I termination factor [Cynara cardunculus var. scolymus]XP_024981345.1 RNA polymerase I termination factor [Cynara cardunculus var. scolymus]XP_024981353.1 RNA polymerase I termination factor [Cynara cardunculus var. scolymus]KVI09925.1 Homeodomain-like protein [Cynara cardunculus var. scolymus]
MDKIGEDAPVKMAKKSKKSKNKTNDMLDVGDDNCHVEDGGVPKKKGHKHKEKKRKSESNEDQRDNGNLEDDCNLQKKDKKRKRDSSENNHPSDKTQIEENEQARDNEPAVEKDCDPKPRKEKKRKHKHHSHESELENDGKEEDCQEDMFKKVDTKKKTTKTDDQNSDAEMNGITHEESGNKGKKKSKSIEKNSEKQKAEGKEKTPKSVENNTEKPKTKGKAKKVSFSGRVEVFPSSDTEPEKQKMKGDGLVRGKRFTPEEDAIVKEAVLNYIEAHGLGDEGLKMVLNCKSHAGMKKCWQEIATCIPYRPSSAVYYRAHILFERAESRAWTPEEIERLKEFHEKDGNKWKMMAEELGKHRFHVKDTWRRIKLKDLKAGKWSQEEYQSLYDLVNLDLQMKITSEVKQSKHGMLRDNIPWTAISEKLSTRSDATCCYKWYNQLTSSLVAEKKWCDADDYRLIGKLYELDAACVEDVDWDNLLEHRPGDVCQKRWNQMVCHIGHQGSKPFSEQVDTLAKRYCPDLADIREAWDNKPVV